MVCLDYRLNHQKHIVAHSYSDIGEATEAFG